MEITPNKISGSPQELADYFRCSGQTVPNLTTPKLSDAISGKLIWAVSIVTGILLIALGFISNPIAYRILFGVIILGIFAIPILLLCKYNSLKIAGSVFLFLAVVLALFLGVTNPKTLSDMAIEKISSQK